MVFRKGGRLRDDLNFIHNNSQIEIVNKFCYLGVVFTAGGSCFETQKNISWSGFEGHLHIKQILIQFYAS